MIFFSTVVLFSIILIISNTANAQTTEEKTNIIQSCEKIYPDLEKLGKVKFHQRYQHLKDFRSCTILYNDLVWFSNDQDRTEKLGELLDKSLHQKVVRNRFIQTQNIPEWIKDDAKRWHQGKEKDNVLSYGIRYMINSKIIQSPISVFNPSNCHNKICVLENDFIKYSIKDTNIDDVFALKHTFQNIDQNYIVTSEKISKDGKTSGVFQINDDGLVELTDQKCCQSYQFAHKIPLQLGTKLDSNHHVQLIGEIIFPYKDQKRSAILAKDRTGNYQEIIDKETGIVLFAKHQNKIKKTEWVAELTDTNTFTKDIKIQYEDMRIPPWFRANVKWWTEGKISDVEYLSGISYMLKHDFMQI